MDTTLKELIALGIVVLAIFALLAYETNKIGGSVESMFSGESSGSSGVTTDYGGSDALSSLDKLTSIFDLFI